MKKKSDGNWQTDKKPRDRIRTYIDSATKAAIHPVRSRILKALKEGEKSTLDLEQITGQARYDLYHHLNKLEQEDLIGWKIEESRIKRYFLKTPENPRAVVVVLEENDIRKKRKDFNALVDLVSGIEGEEIPHRNRIARAEICFYYEPSAGDHVSQELDPSGQKKK